MKSDGALKKTPCIRTTFMQLCSIFGINHELSYRFQGRDFRLTGVAGKVIKD